MSILNIFCQNLGWINSIISQYLDIIVYVLNSDSSKNFVVCKEGKSYVTSNSSRTTFKILVDADSCPVKDNIYKVAQGLKIPVLLVASTSHRICSENDGIQTITVDNSPQAVDLALMNYVAAGDIVVTGDYGLAVLALSKQATPLSPRGFIFTDRNIDSLLLQRHMEAKIRRGGGRTKGPKVFTAEDSQRFAETLRKLIIFKLQAQTPGVEKGFHPPEG